MKLTANFSWRSVWRSSQLVLAGISLLSLNACQTATPLRQYDMQISSGVAPVKSTGFKIQLADIQVAEQFDSQQMWYRLTYQQAQESRPYAESRWSMPPAQLLAQRLKSRWLQAEIQVAGMQHGVAGLPRLKLELDDFSQHFSSAQQSQARISLRASLIHQHQLLAQKAFSADVPASNADASGGAKAMSLALDQVLDQLQHWTQLNYPKSAN